MIPAKTYFLRLGGWLLLMVVLVSACKKEYYDDSGLQKGIYPVSSFDHLNSQPFFFDSLITIIKLAGLEKELKDSTVTFFAPTDFSILKAMNGVNAQRHNDFKDSLRLQDIPADVWRTFLSRYIFRDKYMLKDIARRDPLQLNIFPGMNMESLDGYIMNIGVEFSDYAGTRDVGPRRVTITNMGDLASPAFNTNNVATSDMQTKTGIIHVLDANHTFGFGFFGDLVAEYIQ